MSKYLSCTSVGLLLFVLVACVATGLSEPESAVTLFPTVVKSTEALIPTASALLTPEIHRISPEPGEGEIPTVKQYIPITSTIIITSLEKENIPVSTHPPIPTPSNPTQQEWINSAKQDLANRLNIDVDQVELVEFKFVIWPDAGLGCPQAGIAYKQIQQDGYLIRLQVGKRTYNYHGGGRSDRLPFLCENPLESDNLLPPPGFGDE